MTKLGKIKTLTIASLSAVALAAPIAFAQSTTTTQDTPQATGERHGGHGKGWGDKGREGRGWGGQRPVAAIETQGHVGAVNAGLGVCGAIYAASHVGEP